MAVSKNIFVMCCLGVFLNACDGGSGGDNNSGLFVPLENTPTTTALDERQLDILDKIKRRSSDDGAQYQFDQLNPIFLQDGDTITVNFDFVNPDTGGGTPIVEYSIEQNQITSIVYTQ